MALRNTMILLKNFIQKYKKTLIISAITAYIGICAYFYYYQNHMLFHPERAPKTSEVSIDKYAFEWSHDGIKHHGWYIHGDQKKPLIVYMGGNSEIISKNLKKFYENYGSQYDILAIEYRGFGGSEGAPNEKSLIEDNIALIKQWMTTYGYAADDIVLIGRSLGTGVAVQVAQQIKPRGIVLVTPFDSVNALASEQYPYIPIAWLNQNPFLSVKYAPALSMPGLIIIAGDDTITPPANGLRLAQCMGRRPWIALINAANHGNIYQYPETWYDIKLFLKSLFDSGVQQAEHYLNQAHYHLQNA